MAYRYRIAIGYCDCTKPHRDSIDRDACEQIEAHRQAWQVRLPNDLTAVPAGFFEAAHVSGCRAVVGVSRHELDDGDTLIVFQAFVHTWSRPTYLAVGAVGRMYAEGLIVTRDGTVRAAPDDVMSEFR